MKLHVSDVLWRHGFILSDGTAIRLNVHCVLWQGTLKGDSLLGRAQRLLAVLQRQQAGGTPLYVSYQKVQCVNQQ